MEIHLKCKPLEAVRIVLNGQLVAEIAAAQAATYADLAAEVNRARRLEAVPSVLESFAERIATIHNLEDHTRTKPADKIVSFLCGFADGLLGRTVPHPYAGVPAMLPAENPTYAAGYEYGESIKRITPAEKS